MGRSGQWLRLPPAERQLVLRALGYTVAVRLCAGLVSFPTLCRLLGSARPRRGPVHAPDRVAWAVAAAGRLVPRSTCYTEAIAAHLLLRRSGWPAVLCLGVAGDEAGFRAHAWIESNGRILIGKNPSKGFTELARIG